MKTVILAAGKGVRLQPITLTRPKVLIPIGGKPLLEHMLKAISECGINEVLIIVYYMAEKIKEHLGDSPYGFKVEYARQKGVLGTANAISLAESYINGDFLVVYGDLLISGGVIKSVLEIHRKLKPQMTMALVEVENFRQYGMVKVENNRVVEIVEKPEFWDGEKLANAGIYVFSSSIFDEIRKTEPSKRGEIEITDTIQALIDSGAEIAYAKISRKDWLDVGRPWDILEANKRVLMNLKPEINGWIESGATITGPVIIGEDTKIRSGAYIEGPVFIGEESDIGPNCYIRPFTSIGRDVRIGNACEIKNSVVMDHARIGHLSYVGDSIIGEECNLGAGTITANLRFDKKPIKMMVKGELVSSGRKKLGTIMGDKAQTGIGVLIMPGIKIGPESWIGPGTIVYRDVPKKTFVIAKQELEFRMVPEKK